METQNRTLIDGLLGLGFSRQKIAGVAGISVPDVTGVKLGMVELSKTATKKLKGLLRWGTAMRAEPNFSFRPGAYYEQQIIVLCVNGEKQYTPLARLYENNSISTSQMIELTRSLPSLYDYNAFIDEFPEQANINLDAENEEKLILHHGLPAVGYERGTRPANKQAVKKALSELAEEAH